MGKFLEGPARVAKSGEMEVHIDLTSKRPSVCVYVYSVRVYTVCTRVKVLYNSMYIACLVILLHPQPYRITESGVQRGKRKISH